jgi:hypothetical protein
MAIVVGLAHDSSVFMLIYYKGAGFNACVAQILNLYIMFSVLSAFNMTAYAVFSIAGMILTIGMAVDANVIIFERIKEETSGRERVDSCFDRCWFRQRILGHHGLQHHDVHRGYIPFAARNGFDPGIRSEPCNRCCFFSVHGSVRIARLMFRLQYGCHAQDRLSASAWRSKIK